MLENAVARLKKNTNILMGYGVYSTADLSRTGFYSSGNT
jgi:hypothetical protein